MSITLLLVLRGNFLDLAHSFLHFLHGSGLNFHVDVDLGFGSSSLGSYLQHIGRSTISGGDSGITQEDLYYVGFHLNDLVTLYGHSMVALVD